MGGKRYERPDSAKIAELHIISAADYTILPCVYPPHVGRSRWRSFCGWVTGVLAEVFQPPPGHMEV